MIYLFKPNINHTSQLVSDSAKTMIDGLGIDKDLNLTQVCSFLRFTLTGKSLMFQKHGNPRHYKEQRAKGGKLTIDTCTPDLGATWQ